MVAVMLYSLFVTLVQANAETDSRFLNRFSGLLKKVRE